MFSRSDLREHPVVSAVGAVGLVFALLTGALRVLGIADDAQSAVTGQNALVNAVTGLLFSQFFGVFIGLGGLVLLLIVLGRSDEIGQTYGQSVLGDIMPHEHRVATNKRPLPQSESAPGASLVFNASDENCVQPGRVVHKSDGERIPCDEYIYALGVVNTNTEPVSGCKVILQESEPHDTSQHRWGRTMRVRNDPKRESEGAFTLTIRDGKHPSAYVEVLQEIVPTEGDRQGADIRLLLASTTHGRPQWFTRGNHLLTFRLEGERLESSTFQLLVRYSNSRDRWDVGPV